MAKGKQKKGRYAVVRTDIEESCNTTKKVKQAAPSVLLAVASCLTKVGFDRTPLPPFVGLILLFTGVATAWFWLVQSFPFLARKYIHYPGYVLILAAVLLLAWLSACEVGDAPKDSSETSLGPPPITTTLRDSPGSSVVTSQGQTGGITAQTVKNPIINNYFTNQSPDQKEEWRQYLNKEYPLGWAMHATDGREVYTPRDLSYEEYFVATWNTNEVLELTPDTITLQFPDIHVKGRNADIKAYSMILKRQVGTYPWFVSEKISVIADILKDEGDFVVFVVGFRKPTEAELRELQN